MEIVENSSFQQFADKKPFVKGKNSFVKGPEPYFFADFCVLHRFVDGAAQLCGAVMVNFAGKISENNKMFTTFISKMSNDALKKISDDGIDTIKSIVENQKK